ncbi:MAG TPA: hypothetical protein VD794_03550 [Flavisolibacter sp.]|nr:hypothetical protein [Flavisolibacter sp.]
MAFDRNDKSQQNNTNTGKSSQNAQTNGIVTVNDDNNPSREERDAKIGNEPDTERLRSERESVEEGKRNSNSL